MIAGNPDVPVVVILSKDEDNLQACVAAVQEMEPNIQILVIWDGPSDFNMGSGRKAVWGYHGMKPFIFARNANQGILRLGDSDVILLNDDALLKTPGGFSKMAAWAREQPRYGIIASTCNNVGNPNQFPRSHPTVNVVHSIREEERMVCFTCVLIPRRTINAVGLLDERFVDYGCEDDDYCLRVRNAGLKIAIHEGCFCDHSSLKSSFRGGPNSTGDFRPNLRRFIEKWGVDNWGRPRETSNFKELFPE